VAGMEREGEDNLGGERSHIKRGGDGGCGSEGGFLWEKTERLTQGSRAEG